MPTYISKVPVRMDPVEFMSVAVLALVLPTFRTSRD